MDHLDHPPVPPTRHPSAPPFHRPVRGGAGSESERWPVRVGRLAVCKENRAGGVEGVWKRKDGAVRHGNEWTLTCGTVSVI